MMLVLRETHAVLILINNLQIVATCINFYMCIGSHSEGMSDGEWRYPLRVHLYVYM